jgi:hypothetical protein
MFRKPQLVVTAASSCGRPPVRRWTSDLSAASSLSAVSNIGNLSFRVRWLHTTPGEQYATATSSVRLNSIQSRQPVFQTRRA